MRDGQLGVPALQDQEGSDETDADDAVKAVMAGAHAIQMVAALLTNGPRHLARVRQDLSHWFEEREYDSLAQAQGSMSLLRCPDPEAFERGNYMKTLTSYVGRAI